tara:strand:+ start:549 stop:1397 length:849 start_codon:yes stop_codon:yes gene_type:complete
MLSKNVSINIPLLEESSYMISSQYNTENQMIPSKKIFNVINHPDKLIKRMEIPGLYRYSETEINSAPNDVIYLYGINYLVGELGIGAKIYGYYIRNTNIINKDGTKTPYIKRKLCIIMEKIEGDILLCIDKTYMATIYNKILKVSELLIDNGIKHDYIRPDSVILQSNGKIKILDFRGAYNICNPHPSKKAKLIKLMVFSLHPDVFNLYPDFVEERHMFLYQFEYRNKLVTSIHRREYFINKNLVDSDLLPKNTIYEDKSKTILDYRQISESLSNNSLFFHD